MVEINIDLENTKEEPIDKEKIRGFVWHNYKMKYAKDKRGFWLIVNYRKQKYFGFIDEKLLGQVIQNNKTAETMEAVIDNLTERILKKHGRS